MFFNKKSTIEKLIDKNNKQIEKEKADPNAADNAQQQIYKNSEKKVKELTIDELYEHVFLKFCIDMNSMLAAMKQSEDPYRFTLDNHEKIRELVMFFSLLTASFKNINEYKQPIDFMYEILCVLKEKNDNA